MAACELCGEKSCSCKAKKPVRVRFCPECKSTDVKFVFKLQSLFGLLPRMECMKCGNHAPDFPVVVVPASKKKVVKKKSKNKSGGRKRR
jgi:Zn ribbon nucleic-acid-binding protein